MSRPSETLPHSLSRASAASVLLSRLPSPLRRWPPICPRRPPPPHRNLAAASCCSGSSSATAPSFVFFPWRSPHRQLLRPTVGAGDGGQTSRAGAVEISLASQDVIWVHFHHLPDRYVLDVNVERAEDVVTYQQLHEEA